MPPDAFRRPTGPNRWEALALFLWALALAIVSVEAALSPQHHSVYPIFAGAARNWLAGTDLYTTQGEPYRYSPLAAVLFVPFGLLPDALGGLLWRWLNAAVFLAALAWWCRDVLPQTLTRSQRGGLFLLVLPLALGNLHNGQSNLLVLALLLAAVAGMAPAAGHRGTRQRHLAGAAAALACLFKVYPIALCLLLVVVAPRRFGWRLLLMLLIGLALPFLFGRPDYVAAQYLGWLRHLRESDRCGLLREVWYRDLRLLCAVCGVPLGAQAYMAVQVLAGAGMAVVCLAARRGGWPPRCLLTLLTALGCCWMTVFGSAAESVTYVLIAPTASWAVLDAWLRGRSRGLRGLTLAGYGLLMVAQMATWFPWGRSFHSLGVQPAAGLLLLAALLPDVVRAVPGVLLLPALPVLPPEVQSVRR